MIENGWTKRLKDLEEENARLREALEAIKRHQELVMGVIPGIRSTSHQIAVDALDGKPCARIV